MRLLVEILLVILMVCLGWSQPFRDHVANLFPQAGIAPSRTAQLAAMNAGLPLPPPALANPDPGTPEHSGAANAATPSGGGNWMWQEKPMDKAHDTPAHVRTR